MQDQRLNNKIDLTKPYFCKVDEDVLIEVSPDKIYWYKYYLSTTDGEHYKVWESGKTGKECNYNTDYTIVFNYARHIEENKAFKDRCREIFKLTKIEKINFYFESGKILSGKGFDLDYLFEDINLPKHDLTVLRSEVM